MPDITNVSKSLLQTIGEAVNLYNGLKTTSLTEVTKVARVEPLAVISKDIATLDYLPEVMQSLLSIFTAYYLQAVALSAKVENVKVTRLLDTLNPDRDAGTFMAGLGMESVQDTVLLFKDAYRHTLPTRRNQRSLEAAVDSISARPGDDSIKTLNEMTNMAVGKVVTVEFKIGEQSLKLPVTVRLTPSLLTNNSILHILALKTEDDTLVERYHAWRSGRLTLIRDLILCQDMVDARKDAMMNDSDGVLSEIQRRANNAKKYGLMSGMPSLVSASNLFVISEEVAKTLEMKLGGKLSNATIRQKAFENTYAMIITVIDRDSERVTFYHRGIAAATEVSVRDIKASNKNKGPDIMDMLKSFNQASAPTF